MLRSLSIALMIFLGGAASSAPAQQIQKRWYVTKKGIKFYWWPKLAVPAGWRRDRRVGLGLGNNMLVPKGKTFANAETVMYGKACYLKDYRAGETLGQFIKEDIVEDRKQFPTVRIAEVTPGYEDAADRHLRTYSFVIKSGAYERVCYEKEGEYFLIFAISSKTNKALLRDLPLFKHMLAKVR